MSLAAAEGRWSCWVKRTGECFLCGDGKALWHCAGVSSLFTGCSNPLPRCFFLTGPREEENGRVQGAESLSEVKAIREHREVRLKLSQWEQSVPLCARSAWNFPKHDSHSAWVSSACRGDLHVLQWRRGICKFFVEIWEICSSDRCRMAAGDDRVCKLVAARGPNRSSRLAFNGGIRLFSLSRPPLFSSLLASSVSSHIYWRDSLCTALQTGKLWIWSTGLSA